MAARAQATIGDREEPAPGQGSRRVLLGIPWQNSSLDREAAESRVLRDVGEEAGHPH